jgi:acyl dehydratase
MKSYPLRFFEDFKVGDRFVSAQATLTREECLAFARSYDPQPFHLDDAAAESSMFGRLSASGWQTAAVTMRLIVESGFLRGTGVLGTGIDELRWLAPVYPGDTLRVESEIVELVPDAREKPRGRMRIRVDVYNQENVRVMSHVANLTVGYKPKA